MLLSFIFEVTMKLRAGWWRWSGWDIFFCLSPSSNYQTRKCLMLYTHLRKSMIHFCLFLIDQKKTYNYYSTLSFTSNKVYDEFGKEASENFTEMSQKIESMVSLSPPFLEHLLALSTKIFSILASQTSIQLILYIFAKWRQTLPERYKTKLTIHDLEEHSLQD